MDSSDYLAREARTLAHELFGVAALSDEVLTRYVLAHHTLFAGAAAPSAADAAFVRSAVHSGADLEGLELVLRLRDRRNILSQKALILSYLLEATIDFHRIFIGDQGRVRAALALAWHSLRTVVKYGRGLVALRRLKAGAHDV